MNHTYELRVHRRGHRLKQEELAHLLGVTPSMIVRMEQGAKAQVACLELVIGLEVVFGKPLSQTLAALHTHVADAMMHRAPEIAKVWRTLGDAEERKRVDA